MDRYNQDARPFNWKFTAADLARLLDRISAREHAAQNRPNYRRQPYDPDELPESPTKCWASSSLLSLLAGVQTYLPN